MKLDVLVSDEAIVIKSNTVKITVGADLKVADLIRNLRENFNADLETVTTNVR